jgi:hypothetical protein
MVDTSEMSKILDSIKSQRTSGEFLIKESSVDLDELSLQFKQNRFKDLQERYDSLLNLKFDLEEDLREQLKLIQNKRENLLTIKRNLWETDHKINQSFFKDL